MKTETIISSELHITEASESKQRTKSEMDIPDPSDEVITKIVNGQSTARDNPKDN